MSINYSAFVDELTKIGFFNAAQAVAATLGEHAPAALKRPIVKPLALMGGGALTYQLAKNEVDKYLLGRQMYDRMQGG